MDKTLTALKLAEEALLSWKSFASSESAFLWEEDDDKALAAIREALAKPVKQEPVAWRCYCCDMLQTRPPVKQSPVAKNEDGRITWLVDNWPQNCLLYTARVQREWVELTDDEIEQAVLSVNSVMEAWITYRAVIAAFKAKQEESK